MKTSHWIMLGIFAWLIWRTLRRLGDIQLAVAGIGGEVERIGARLSDYQRQLKDAAESEIEDAKV